MKYETVQQLFVPYFRSRLRTVSGLEHVPPPPYIIAANHLDFLDGFLIASAFVVSGKPAPHFISKTNNYGWTRATIQVNPDDPAMVLDRALEHLRQGRTMCIFVEGRRNHTPAIPEGKTGAVRLALAAKVPIIPVGIQGPLPSTFFFGSLWHLLWRPKSVTIQIGRPFLVSEPTDPNHDELRRLTADLMAVLAPLCGKHPSAS